MTKNRQIAETVFCKMKELRYEPYDIEYGNGYFLFDYGEDSVVHFRVKGLWKHWKFGMWIFSEELDKPDDEKNKSPLVQIFAQYDTQIDKFKPSRSNLLVNLNAADWNGDGFTRDLFWYWELERMLNMMRHHPLLCYCGMCGEYVGYYHGNGFLAEFIKYESEYYFGLVKKSIMTSIFLPYTKFKIFLSKRDKCIKSIDLYDFEKENPGWKTSYLYEVIIVFVKDVTDSQINEWFNKWFRKTAYGRFGHYDSVIEIQTFRIDGEKRLYGTLIGKG